MVWFGAIHHHRLLCSTTLYTSIFLYTVYQLDTTSRKPSRTPLRYLYSTSISRASATAAAAAASAAAATSATATVPVRDLLEDLRKLRCRHLLV